MTGQIGREKLQTIPATQMMGKAGEEKVEECDLLGPWSKESFPVEFEEPLVSHRPDRSNTGYTLPGT